MKDLDAAAAIEARMVAYCYKVDALEDLDGLLDFFAADGVFDLSPLGLARFEGHAAIRGFFAGVLADMTHHAHFLSNFRLDALDGDRAAASAYVTGMGRARSGSEVLVHVRYDWALVREADAWRATRFTITPLMPPPGSLGAIHGTR